MEKVEILNITRKDHKTLSDNDAGEGSIACACGGTYDFSLMRDENLVDCSGFIFPRCPYCLETPHSDTRRCDL